MVSSQQIAQLITIYLGFPIFICGILGNSLNILCLWKIRRNPCGFILSTLSITNVIVLVVGLLTRILSVGFNLEWTNTNFVWCKLRIPLTQSFVLISISCVCLASIDRFFHSSRHVKLRHISNLLIARCAVIIIIIIWLVHSIPFVIFTDLTRNSSTGSTTCLINPNHPYVTYRIYVVFPFYYGLIPSGILLGTGLMTCYNINKLQLQRQRQLIQRQLSLMIIMQIPIIILSIMPYCVITAYTALTSNMIKTIQQQNMDIILTALLTNLFYISFACQFFVFYISSAAFREEAKYFVLCKRINNNRIQPFTMTANQATKYANN